MWFNIVKTTEDNSSSHNVAWYKNNRDFVFTIYPVFEGKVKKLKELFEEKFKTSISQAEEQIWNGFTAWVIRQFGRKEYQVTILKEHIDEFYRRVEKMFSFLSGSNVSIKFPHGHEYLNGELELTIDGNFIITSELLDLLTRDKQADERGYTPATVQCPMVHTEEESWAHICLQSLEIDAPLFDKVATVLMYLNNVERLNTEDAAFAAYWKYLTEHGIDVQAESLHARVQYEFIDLWELESFLKWKLLDNGFEARIFSSNIDIVFHENEWKIILDDIMHPDGEEYYFLSDDHRDFILDIRNFGLSLPEHLGEHGPLRQIDLDRNGADKQGNYRT